MPDTSKPRKPLISGNWKMHHNHFEAIQLVQKLSYAIHNDEYDRVDVSVHPPFTDLRSIQTVLDADKIPILLGAQHCHYEDKGAFTGEVSPAMLLDCGCRYVILGHSERRHVLHEDDALTNRKLQSALAAGLYVILCVGETLQERDAGRTEKVVARQLDEVLTTTGIEAFSGAVVAYEPVWAIGTGRTATPEQAQAVHAFIRKRIFKGTRILYGGSVKPDNAAAIFAMPDVDGGLIGGASLAAKDFLGIVKEAAKAAARAAAA